MLVLLVAGSAIVLAAPRPVAPDSVPRPRIDNHALLAAMERDDVRAREAVQATLPLEVRAAGAAIRAYNRAAAGGDDYALAKARRDALEAAGEALPHGTEPLLRLRAFQMLRFIEELAGWQAGGEPSSELVELGGDFVATLVRNRWCRAGTRELVLGERELRVLFKKRWNDVTGLQGQAFDLGLDEDRVRYGFLIHHPFTSLRSSALQPTERRAQAARDGAERLRLIERLAQRDPSYLADLARGVVSYQMGEHAAAAEHFRRHLAAHPDGAYTLRARNYLRAALEPPP
jgi:hypothetical protein